MELFAIFDFRQIWFMIPLVFAYALVNAGTRYEQIGPIFKYAAKYSGGLFLFLAAVYLILLLVV